MKKNLFKKGHKGYWKGKKRPSFSQETRDKMSQARKGKKLSKEHIEKSANSRKGKHYSIETEFKKGHTQPRGKDSPLWKGGQKLQFIIRTCNKYTKWRLSVFTRDGFICQKCGDKSGGNLEAHHIVPLSILLKENKIKTLDDAINCEMLWNIENGITLCKDCHSETDTYFNKFNNKYGKSRR